MTTSFDFHTLSLTLDQTLDEYTEARSDDLGLHLWEGLGDRSKKVRFRHEHAHFTSFLASGLADLYGGILSDYITAVLYSVLWRKISEVPGRTLALPLFMGSDEDLPPDVRQALTRAWRQINDVRAFLFGFGTAKDLEAVINPGLQDDFWAIFFDLRLSKIVQRYYRLLKCLADHRKSATNDGGLPRVRAGRTMRILSARAVMEAYAITIELFNTHFRKLEGTGIWYSEPLGRNPGPLYTVAIEYLLERGLNRVTTLEEFLNGKAPIKAYESVAAISFAAMQIPVVQELEGEVRFTGTLESLSPAHRFHRIVEALRRGKLRSLPSGLRNDKNTEEMLSWLADCHRVVGDDDSLTICKAAYERYERDDTLRAKAAHEMGAIQMGWAARANFFSNPTEYVLDAGLFAERYRCQVRYVRTSDGKLAVAWDSVEDFQLSYISDHMPVVLEAAVFAQQWDSTWAKLPEIGPEERADTLMSSLAAAVSLFGDFTTVEEWKVSSIALRM